MSGYTFKSEQLLPIDIEHAWNFFSSPGNLAKITPPEMEFRILTKLDGKDIYEGMHIEYIVRPLFGIPMRWKTEIGPTERLHSFMDKQIKGPYKVWEHTHTFTEVEGGVLMKDVVYYELPMGFLGDIAHRLLVRKKIEKIFEYRTKVLNSLFKSK